MPLYDVTCIPCGNELDDQWLPYRDPGLYDIECDVCGKETKHKRNAVQLIAVYMGEKPYSPMVYGGTSDTTGYGKHPLSNDMVEMAKQIVRSKDPDEVVERTRDPKWKAAVAMDKAHKKNQRAKRLRTKLIKSGQPYSVRHNPLPGDPKL